MPPSKFMQLLVIRVPLGDSAVSVVYAFLQRKTQDTCKEQFKANIMINFDHAIQQAIIAVVGSEVTCRGCFYHLSKASWKKIQELGLATI